MNYDYIKTVIDQCYIVGSPEFQELLKGKVESKTELATKLNKKFGTVSKYFHDHKMAWNNVLAKNQQQLVLNELGKEIAKHAKEITLFSTVNKKQMMELYVKSIFPGIGLHEEMNDYSFLNYTKFFKKKRILKRSIDGVRIDTEIKNMIKSRKSIVRLLSDDVQKQIQKINTVFNLMSYYSASSIIFKRINQDRNFWLAESRHFSDYNLKKMLTIRTKINELLKNAIQNVESLRNVNGVFQVRSTLLPMERIPINSDFVVEGSEVVKTTEKRKSPDIMIIGYDAWLYKLSDEYYPLAMIKNNSIQVVVKKDKKLGKGEKVKVVSEPLSSAWSKLQSDVIFSMRMEKANGSEYAVNGYKDIAAHIQNQNIDLAVVPAPMHHLAEVYGYTLLPLDEEQFYSNALLIIRKDLAEESPEIAKTILDMCEENFDSYGGKLDITSRKFEHFVGSKSTKILNKHSLDILGLSKTELNKLVNDKIHNI